MREGKKGERKGSTTERRTTTEGTEIRKDKGKKKNEEEKRQKGTILENGQKIRRKIDIKKGEETHVE